MAATAEDLTARPLGMVDELILLLLNEQNGYFHQVPGWNLNCAVIGAVLAELSLLSRIDTDMESLYLVDPTETGDPALDPILKQIAADPVQRNARYWIERLVLHAEPVIDLTLDRLVDMKLLERHNGDFYTLASNKFASYPHGNSREGTAGQFIKARISTVILTDSIPDPRDVIIISLVNTCDVFRFMLELDEEAEGRLENICRMDLIGRSIADAVKDNIANPLLRRSTLNRKIPSVPLRQLLLNPHLRTGNIPALFAELTESFGPVFRVCPPFRKPLTFISGAKVNQWVHRHGRMYLRARDYFADFEKIYGASGVLPSLDGTDHFRLRKALSPAYSRERLAGQMDRVLEYGRKFMADWKVGDTLPATRICRRMINAQLSPLFIGVESQDIFDDLISFKERALNVHIMRLLPEFMLGTPRMKRTAKAIDILLKRIEGVHTPAQRAGCPRDLADDLLSLHESDPQLVPESNLRFALSASLVASVYMGDAFSFAVYAMASQPDLYRKIQSEADALFEGGDPDGESFSPSAVDITRRFLMECLRMYPIVPMSVRNVMNSCVVEGYELPVGTRVHIAQSASHFMEESFPDPFSFDINRYLPARSEHRGPGYAPYGLGTHRCLGSRWMNLQLVVNLIMVARYFTLEIYPENYKLRFNPLPSLKPDSKLRFRVAERRRELQN
ncbi:MAG: cytochrome P450 [Alphaproteobacteria bacterium]|nr:cytochrome P450 [Alphaproteobacteria bacterium]